MRSALLALLGAWALHAGAVPNEDRRNLADHDPWSATAARSADDRSWYGQATGRDGGFASPPAAQQELLAFEQIKSPIPEPSTWAMVGGGLGWVVLLGWRRRRSGRS